MGGYSKTADTAYKGAPRTTIAGHLQLIIGLRLASTIAWIRVCTPVKLGLRRSTRLGFAAERRLGVKNVFLKGPSLIKYSMEN